MPVGADKERMVGYVDTDVAKELRRIAKEAGVSESKIVSACIECGLDEFHFVEFLGLTPRRLGSIRKLLEKLREKYGKKSEKVQNGVKA